ncbi:cytochrome c [uncultured Devosia sp.]|uniref:cytochrome c n=1 Tax=uncultured Devosia sp. TaxID=211434 RepID=UPI00259A13DC|nr:cytochrome c [uncultured Devosia sp.]
MLRPAIVSALVVICLGTGLVLAEAPDNAMGDTIAARRGLMNQLATLQTLVDARVGSGNYSPELYDLGQAAAASFDAFAVLLPPQSNLLGGAPAIEGVDTTAAAAIWDDLPAFRQLLRDTAAHARAASEAADLAGFQAEWDKVAQSCSSCHESYVVFDPFAAFN